MMSIKLYRRLRMLFFFDDLVFVILVFRAMDGDYHNAPCFSLSGLAWLSVSCPWHQASRQAVIEGLCN